jgi:hypothetical protein
MTTPFELDLTHHPYYGLGHLFFFHKSADGIRILACPCPPGVLPQVREAQTTAIYA